MKRLIIAGVLLIAARFAAAEVQIIKGGESDQPAGERSATILRTRDRQVAPSTQVTKETKTGPNTGRAETMTRLRNSDGSYFDWQRVSVVATEPAPGKIERTTEVVERDRQGDERDRKLIKQTTEKTGASERARTAEYRPDSSGSLKLTREIAAVTTKSGSSGKTETRTESDYDVNGRPVVTRQVEAVTTAEGGQSTTTTTIKSVDHLRGNVGIASREVATVRTEGNTTRTESVRQRPAGFSWEHDGRTLTTETRLSNGTVQRETIVESRSMYARQGGRTELGELVPQTRIIDREVRQPDGTALIHRDIYRRDVNGDWKATTFSTEGADRAAW